MDTITRYFQVPYDPGVTIAQIQAALPAGALCLSKCTIRLSHGYMDQSYTKIQYEPSLERAIMDSTFLYRRYILVSEDGGEPVEECQEILIDFPRVASNWEEIGAQYEGDGTPVRVLSETRTA